MKYYITPIAKLARYNIKIIFGNKFMYFILSAVGFYILTVGLNLISIRRLRRLPDTVCY